jgi:hypothetical protein
MNDFYVDMGLGVTIVKGPRRQWVDGLATYDWYWALPHCTSHIVD